MARPLIRTELGREITICPEIHTNGCKLAREPVISRRRSARTGGTGYTPAKRARPLPSWALSPQAVEAIRTQMLLCLAPLKTILAQRDATIVSLQYGMASATKSSGDSAGHPSTESSYG